KVCQTLARHSTPSLTIGVYAKASIHDLAGAVSGLPELTGPDNGPESAMMAATGTDGRRISNRFAPHLPHSGDGLGRIGADAVVVDDAPVDDSACPKSLALSALGGTSRAKSVRVADGIRTRDPQI